MQRQSHYGKNVRRCNILTNEVISEEIFDECHCVPVKHNSRTPSSKISTGKVLMMKLCFIKFVKNFHFQTFAPYGILFMVALHYTKQHSELFWKYSTTISNFKCSNHIKSVGGRLVSSEKASSIYVRSNISSRNVHVVPPSRVPTLMSEPGSSECI